MAACLPLQKCSITYFSGLTATRNLSPKFMPTLYIRKKASANWLENCNCAKILGLPSSEFAEVLRVMENVRTSILETTSYLTAEKVMLSV